ncbi:MAG: GMC family oxidoreductase N-terminal domain-containing protein [Bdellovibrionales bacterium]|nr:GMC family oxidoreductase N-terminal domain-containing protein [Ramlibacter sp.]
MDYDFLIVGGGTAGAVVAARLSENASLRVLLVEAGDDLAPGTEPADIKDGFPAATLNPSYFWNGLTARSEDTGAAAPYPQARVLGGGSSINGMFALRGVPTDYSRWAAAGAGDFSWETVAPHFRRIEDDRDNPGSPAGPHAMVRTPKAQWPAFARAMEAAAQQQGLPFVPNINEHTGDGFFAMPNAVKGDTRVTSAGCYLTQAVRARPNLKILTRTEVLRLCMDEGTVTGVEVLREGIQSTLHARRVIVSAGGIFSPTLLLRSGIGPAGELAALGITPAVNLQGVGRNLQNHPYMFFALTLPRGKRMATSLRRFAVAGMRSSSHMPGSEQGDLFGFVIGRVSGQSFGPSFALVGSALYAPKSRGSVTLTSRDPSASPQVDFRFLSDPADPPRMVQAARLCESLLRDPQVAAEYHEAFLLPGALAVKQFNRPGLAGKALSLAADAAANAPRSIRQAIFGWAFKSGKPVAWAGGGRAVSDQDILSSISPMGHPVGTCAMGATGDAMAVVDESFRVHGTQNLYVVDASVMPNITSANTNLPTMMLAEVAAERIKAADL